MASMKRSKKIREIMAGDYETASDQGISKKALKLIVKERALERQICGLHDDLEPDERSELEMLTEKLGDYANTPLGAAALDKAKGDEALSSVGA
jgi:hypothetical protein